MPNHLHGVVVINKPDENGDGIGETDGSIGGAYGPIVETHGRASLRARRNVRDNHNNPPFHRLPKSISSFIAGFKSAINTKIDDYIDEHQLDISKYNRHNHFWQPNYHDHVIRNDAEYQRIKQYIKNNPAKWDDDKFYN